MQVVIKAGPDCEHFNSGWFVNIGGQQLDGQRRALRGSTMFVLVKNSGPSGNFVHGGGATATSHQREGELCFTPQPSSFMTIMIFL